MKQVEIYTDGACSGNPGIGGWGVVLRHQGRDKDLYGGEKMTTNNRMELMAVISGLGALKEPCEVLITTDSQYVMKGMTEWIQGWVRKKWRNSQGEPVKNRDLWEQLLKLQETHRFKWQWVKGHSGHPENERADALARKWIEENQ